MLYKNGKIRIYQTIILPVVLYGCETWSLRLREVHRLRVFENRVLRRIFWPKRDEVTGIRRKLHNEVLHNLYSSPSIIRLIKSSRMRREKHVEQTGRRGLHIGHWWEGQKEIYHQEYQDIGAWTIKMDLREIGWNGMEWIDLAQDRDQWMALVIPVINLRVP
jgi:hypothetical protein